MKRKMIVGAAALLLAGVSQAGVIASDNFATDGPLGGSSGGSGFSDAWSGTDYAISGGVVSGSGGSLRTLSTPVGSSGEFWVSFDMGSTGNSYGGLSFFAAGDERLIIGDTYQVGNWGLDHTAGGREDSGISIATTRTAVAKVSLGVGATSTVDVWIGDDALTAVNVSGAADMSATGGEFDGVDQLRIGSGFDMDFADLVLGDTYQDVGAIPEPATLGLIAAFGGGLLFVRRRFAK